MNFRINKNRLYESLQIVSRAISPNSPVPALSGIKIEAEDKKLTLTGSDADISIRLVLDSEKEQDLGLSVIEPGKIVIDYRYLNEIVRKIDSDDIQIEIVDGTLTRFLGSKAEFKINGFRANEYPTLDFSEPEKKFSLTAEKLSEIIEDTAFAANSKDTRLILTGVNMKCSGTVLTCTATDSYRLAKKTADVECEPFSITVLAKSINLARAIFSKPDEEVQIALNDKKIRFSNDSVIMQTRLLEGTYPETDRLIPSEFTNELVVNRRALINAVDRSSFIKTDNMSIIKMEISNDEIVLTNYSQEIGESHEEMVPESYIGEPLSISFTSNYVSEAARTLTTDNIRMKFNGSMKPFILLNEDGDDSILQLVLPVRTYN